MRGALIRVWLFLLLVQGAWAQELTSFVIATEPAGALIVDQYGNELGLTGDRLNVDLKPHGGDLEVTLKLEGYEPKQERIKVRQLKEQGRYPMEGAIALRATSVWVSLATLSNDRPYLAPGLVVTFLVAVVLGVRRHRNTRLRLLRGQELEALRGRARELGDPLVGTLLGSYRVIDRIGLGGTASVYRARNEEGLAGDAEVAVKVLSSEYGEGDEFRRRFHREVKIWKQLSHPNIVSFIDWSEQREVIYLVMELIEGETLRAEFSKGRRGAAEAVDLLEPVFRALTHAHAQGVAHRDLKPENVMRSKDGVLKVTDFGLARTGAEDKLTVTGNWVGTPAYMSPEQIQGAPVDPRSDQYALGIMLYELVDGEVPFADDEPLAVCMKHLSGRPASLEMKWPDLPHDFCLAVEKMMAKSPEERFADLEQALEVLQASSPVG